MWCLFFYFCLLKVQSCDKPKLDPFCYFLPSLTASAAFVENDKKPGVQDKAGIVAFILGTMWKGLEKTFWRC